MKKTITFSAVILVLKLKHSSTLHIRGKWNNYVLKLSEIFLSFPDFFSIVTLSGGKS